MNKENENEGKGSMWAFQQKFDHPMDEEASKLKKTYTETVRKYDFFPKSVTISKSCLLEIICHFVDRCLLQVVLISVLHI